MTDEKKSALAVPQSLADMIVAERPAGSDAGALGNEGIGREDILTPRLGLAQKMSPEVDPTNRDRYIEGLQFTDMFHSLAGKSFGKGPLHFVILRRDKPRWIEFNPLDQGGGIRDMNVPPNDPRTFFTTGPNNERVKPVATMFYDFIVLLLTALDLEDPLKNVIALSLKSSGIKAAKHLNFLVLQRGKKLICKGVYELRTDSATDKKTGGVYAVYKVKNAGWLAAGSLVEKLAIELFESWKDREAMIDRGDNHEEGGGDTDFNPADIEKQDAGAANTEM